MIDQYTVEHLTRWVERTYREEDVDTTIQQFLAFVRQDPDLIDQGYSWPEIRRMMEA